MDDSYPCSERSLRLCENTRICSTRCIKSNHKGWDKKKLSLGVQGRKPARETYKLVAEQTNQILCVQYMDSKIVSLVSTTNLTKIGSVVLTGGTNCWWCSVSRCIVHLNKSFVWVILSAPAMAEIKGPTLFGQQGPWARVRSRMQLKEPWAECRWSSLAPCFARVCFQPKEMWSKLRWSWWYGTAWDRRYLCVSRAKRENSSDDSICRNYLARRHSDTTLQKLVKRSYTHYSFINIIEGDWLRVQSNDVWAKAETRTCSSLLPKK